MPAKDIYHFALKKALEKDDWEITKDPFAISTPGVDFYIDLGAERNFIEAERGTERIAIEVKSLKGNSPFYDYHQALGQFLMYKLALKMNNFDHNPYLAIPEPQYLILNKTVIYPKSWEDYSVNLIVFDEKAQKIIQWIKN
jgi:hypothetical protein